MKVVLMHNRYQSVVPSGENAVVEREAEWLSAAGVVVIPVVRDSDTIGQMMGMERALLPISPIYSVSATRDLASVLRRERPDILHLHNPYPLISPWVVRTARRYDVPVVQTVHNYRHVCAAGTFFRDGHPCYDCLGRRVPYPAVQHACYRGSRLHSAVMAASITVHRSTWRAVQRYLVVTRAMGTHLRSLGIGDDQIVVKPNAVEDPGPSRGPGSGFLFAGRLDEAKGTRLLAEAWKRLPDGALGSLTVAGNGPLRPLIESLAEQRSDVRFIGHQTAEGMKDAFRSASVVLAIPVWNEPFGLTVVEGLANSRPALVTDRGGPPELIGWGEPDPAGWVVPASVEGLTEGMHRALSEADTLRDTARRRYLQQFTPAAVTDTLLRTYQAVAHE